MSDTGRSEHLQSAFGAKSSQEAAEVYDSWAEDYERRVLSWGYATPAVASWFFGRYVQPSDGAAVLDAGAGLDIVPSHFTAPSGRLVASGILPQRLHTTRR